MRNLLIATTGFLAGAGLVAALLLALPRTTNVTVKQAAPRVAAMPHMAQGEVGVMASASSAPATSKLTIQHVLKGCHVWSNGRTTSPMMRLALKPGSKLSIFDQDVDAHQLMQLSGPMRLHLGGPMMTSRAVRLTERDSSDYPRPLVLVLGIPGADGTPALPGNAEDDQRDCQADDRVGDRQTQSNHAGTEKHAEGNEAVDTGVVAVGDQSGAVEAMAGAGADLRGYLVADEADQPGRRQPPQMRQ